MATSEAARELIQRALDKLQTHPELWRTGDLSGGDGSMCALGFLNDAAGRSRSSEMLYPVSAVQSGEDAGEAGFDPKYHLREDDPLVEATKAVAACALAEYPQLRHLGLIGHYNPDRAIYRLNDNKHFGGLEAVQKAFERATQEDCTE
jgi:hypothetical protein